MRCRTCGESVADDSLFCNHCGSETGPESAGAGLGLPLPVQAPAEGSGEALVFESSAPVSDGRTGWRVRVTSRRVTLHRTEGLIMQRTREQSFESAKIGSISLRNEGGLAGGFVLEIDGLQLRGRKSDLKNIYNATSFVRSLAGGSP